ncbi:DUF4286 family protein [Thalassobaculum salexigens]|uniref:DUF4286 family protein n=1 Tax=Thalassobaculum salexigens TaxID=455360 RepID=UPI00248F0C9B|nr:DUF4286 family protein [Thalassobaculum salexigens]
MTDAAMAVWGDTAPEGDAEFSEWYHREHIPERVGMPGWRNGRRYRKIGRGKHRYLAVYDVDSMACFDDPAYRHALDHPTEWTSRMMGHFRNFVRATSRVRFSSGEALGSVIATVRYDPGTGDAEEIARWLAGTALHDLRNREGITRVQHWQADMGRSLAKTAEQAIRAGRDGEAPFTAVVEGTERAFVEAALVEAGIVEGLADRGARKVESGLYSMLFALHG